MHCTVKLLGNINIDQLWVISGTLSKMLQMNDCFSLNLGNADVFPKVGRAGVIWVSLGGDT